MRSALEIFSEIVNEYEKDPLGWLAVSGYDRKSGCEKTYFVHHAEKCWVVMCPKYGLNGFGDRGKIENNELKISEADRLSFGLRPMDEKNTRLLINGYKRRLIEEIAKIEPVTQKELQESDVLGLMRGPVHIAKRPIDAVIPSQSDLEEKLRKELEEFAKRSYN